MLEVQQSACSISIEEKPAARRLLAIFVTISVTAQSSAKAEALSKIAEATGLVFDLASFFHSSGVSNTAGHSIEIVKSSEGSLDTDFSDDVSEPEDLAVSKDDSVPMHEKPVHDYQSFFFEPAILVVGITVLGGFIVSLLAWATYKQCMHRQGNSFASFSKTWSEPLDSVDVERDIEDDGSGQKYAVGATVDASIVFPPTEPDGSLTQNPFVRSVYSSQASSPAVSLYNSFVPSHKLPSSLFVESESPRFYFQHFVLPELQPLPVPRCPSAQSWTDTRRNNPWPIRLESGFLFETTQGLAPWPSSLGNQPWQEAPGFVQPAYTERNRPPGKVARDATVAAYGRGQTPAVD